MNAPCRHFGACGGCSRQHLAADAYLAGKREEIVAALARQGIGDPPLREIAQVPPRSRRRATLKLLKRSDAAAVGFHAPRSHELVDMRECHVLTPGLFAAARGVSACLAPLLRREEIAELYMAQTETGIDVALRWNRRTTPELIGAVSAAAPRLDIVRITSGGDLLFQSAAPTVRFGKAELKPPPGAFLQPTKEGEAILQARAAQALGKAKKIVDLFCGCGTFTLPLAEKAQLHAVDADAPMLEALAAAARNTAGLKPITVERRDLFALPLSPMELNAFDAAVLDPPRTGALAQAKHLAKSRVSRIAYISCDAASFARDARVLLDGGYQLDWIVGVDQFLWSAHVELAAAFFRK